MTSKKFASLMTIRLTNSTLPGILARKRSVSRGDSLAIRNSFEENFKQKINFTPGWQKNLASRMMHLKKFNF